MHTKRGEREREKSLASGRARGSTKRIQISDREKDNIIIFLAAWWRKKENARNTTKTNEPSRVAKKFFLLILLLILFNPYLLLSVFRCHLNARRTSIEHRMEAQKSGLLKV